MHKPLAAILAAACLMVVAIGASGNICRAQITESDLSGTYNWLWAGPEDGAPLVTEGSLSAADRARFDGDGGWTLPRYSGTYTINAGGFLEMTIENSTDPGDMTAYPAQKTDAGAIDPNGNLIALPETVTAGVSIFLKPVSTPLTGDLSGRFNLVEISANAAKELVNRAGYAEFTPSTPPSYTFYEEYNSDAGEVSRNAYLAATYTITDRGYLNSDLRGFISPDENLIVATHQENKDEIVFLLRNDGDMATAEVFGRYHMVTWRYDADSGQYLTESGYLFFDGNGGWDYPAEDESGTYSVDEENRLLIDGRKSWGAVGKNGSLIVIPEPDEQPGISLLVKAPATGDVAFTQNVTATNESGTAITPSVQRTSLTGAQLQDNFGISDLEPVGEVTRIRATFTPSAEPAVVTFGYDLTGLGRTPADYKLIKLRSTRGSKRHLEFSYASRSTVIRDSAEAGEWWLADNNGFYMDAGDELDAGQSHTVYFKVQDNGDYDLAGNMAGEIEDPTVLGIAPEPRSADDDGGGGGGGCFICSLLQ